MLLNVEIEVNKLQQSLFQNNWKYIRHIDTLQRKKAIIDCCMHGYIHSIHRSLSLVLVLSFSACYGRRRC